MDGAVDRTFKPFDSMRVFFSLRQSMPALHDSEQEKHAEMEDEEDQHRDEHCGVFAFFEDLLQH